MKKFFNTAGPIDPEDHYFLPQRLDSNELNLLIEQKKYFILHAPRQTGKTTAILTFVEALKAANHFLALYINVEPAQAARGNVHDGIRNVLRILKLNILGQYGMQEIVEYIDQVTVQNHFEPYSALFDVLSKWSEISSQPIVLFIDEIDSLIGDTLISVLRQLRTGYINRPKKFPASVCLIGVRDVRDYQIFSEEKQSLVLGGSAFNIKAESLVLSNFSLEEVKALYLQHTDATGQEITDDAIQFAFEQTNGQPWLVNALAYQACFRDVTDRSVAITKDVIIQAKYALIARKDTHLDSLLERLKEPRIAAIIDSLISGKRRGEPFMADDLHYAIDLGLVRDNRGTIEISNPIYREIIPSTLTYGQQARITENQKDYLNSDGSLNMTRILEGFTQFYRENADIALDKILYKESGPHLVLMAYLQKIINGGGRIQREYALGRGRVDLAIQFKNDRFVIELKINRGQKSLEEGLMQTAEYMKIQGSKEGHLILFDTSNKPWSEKIYQKAETVDGLTISVWGL